MQNWSPLLLGPLASGTAPKQPLSLATKWPWANWNDHVCGVYMYTYLYIYTVYSTDISYIVFALRSLETKDIPFIDTCFRSFRFSCPRPLQSNVWLIPLRDGQAKRLQGAHRQTTSVHQTTKSPSVGVLR